MLKGISDKIRSFYNDHKEIADKVQKYYNDLIDPIKQEVRPYIKEEDFSKLETTIHTSAGSAAVASAAMAQGSAFGLDTPVLIAIHIGMVIALGEVFGRKLTQNAASALISAAAGVGIGVFGVKAILGFIPIGGNIINAAISFGYTELLGWTIVKYFKGDKDTIRQFEVHLKGEQAMGDTYNIHGQAASVGKNARSNNNTFFQSDSGQTLSEAAAEIQKLLQQLEKTNPTATESEKITYVNNKADPTLKLRVISALKSGSEAAIENFLDNPYVNVGKAIVKGWIKPE